MCTSSNDTSLCKSALVQEILKAYVRLEKTVSPIALPSRSLKNIEGTGGKVSVADLIAYQIGWGKCLIRWYESGIKKEAQEMPGDGFSSWDYTGIAKHFYQKYAYDSGREQMAVFHQVVTRIIEIAEIEYSTGNLDKIGVWPWCTLASGKEWPLSKWIRINTASPYKRASEMIGKRDEY